MTANITLIPLLSKCLLYLQKDQHLYRKKVAKPQISNCKENTFAPFLTLFFLQHQILSHAGNEIKTIGMFTVHSTAQKWCVLHTRCNFVQ